MKGLFKHIFFYLVFFMMIFGIIHLSVTGSAEQMNSFNNGEGGLPIGFYMMFLSMMAFWILLAAIRWFDYYDEMEGPSRTVAKWIGLVASVGVIAVQMVIRIRFELWSPFSCFFTPRALEEIAGNDSSYSLLVTLLLLLAGVVGYCFFTQFTDFAASGEVVEITTYYDSDGFAVDQSISAPYTPVWGAILLGLSTTIIPIIVCGGVGAFPLLAYFAVVLPHYKSRRHFVRNAVFGGILSVFAAFVSICPLFL